MGSEIILFTLQEYILKDEEWNILEVAICILSLYLKDFCDLLLKISSYILPGCNSAICFKY